MEPVELWEILVPTVMGDKPVRTRYHRVWDQKVRAIANGLTIFQPAKGHWVDKEGKVEVERMIPVRVACTRTQIDLIADFSAKYYSQRAIMYYRISDLVVIKSY